MQGTWHGGGSNKNTVLELNFLWMSVTVCHRKISFTLYWENHLQFKM